MLMAIRLSFADIFHERLVMAPSRLLVGQRELAPHEDLIRLFRKVHTIPRLQTDGRRKRVDILHWDVLLGSVVDVRAPLQLAQEIHELHVVELFVQRYVLLVRQLQTVYVYQRYRQVIVVPRIINTTKNLVGHADLGQDQEKPFRSFEDPFHVSVVSQAFTECEWPVEKPTFFASQLRHDEGPRDFRIDAIVSPPELFERSMGRDERVPSITVDVGIQSDLTSGRHNLGDSTRAHDLKRIGKSPCVTGRCM